MAPLCAFLFFSPADTLGLIEANNPLALTIFDEAHSEDEERWVSLARSGNGRFLLVVHTFSATGPSSALVRLIPPAPLLGASALGMSKFNAAIGGNYEEVTP